MSITRRQALLGFATVSAGGAVATLATKGLAAKQADPELLQIGRELAVAEQNFNDACHAEALAFEHWNSIRPIPDAEIVGPVGYRFRIVNYEFVRDPRGDRVHLDELRNLEVAMPESIRRALKRHDGRTREARWLRKMLPEAEQFWRDMEEADERSGATRAGVVLRHAWYELDRLSRAAFENSATSIDGLMVMTRAALLSELGRVACNGGEADHRFMKLASGMHMIAARSA